MADVLAGLLSFPPDNVEKLTPKEYDKEITSYVKNLNKTSSSIWTKPIDKQNILDLLNPAVNTIPYLLALIEQIRIVGKDKTRQEDVLNRTVVFFTSFDAVQARYVGKEWATLYISTIDMLLKLGIWDFSPLSNALLRLDPTAGTFTTLHLRFLRLCAQHAPSQALPILSKTIYAYPQASVKGVPEEPWCDDHELSNSFITANSGFTQKLTPDYILEYYLLGAHVYIGQRDWKRARLFLEYVMLTPSQNHACSAMQVEAYKKWVMVGLLSEGKLFPLPRAHDQTVMKNMKAIAKPYDTLADTFEKRDWRKYQAEMDNGTQIWHEDGNLRLVSEVSHALLRYRVIDLQKTFAALPVGRVATHLSFTPDYTLQMLTTMIHQGDLSASISPTGSSAADAVLRFHTTSSGPRSADAQDADLEAQTKRIEDLVTFVRDADRRLQLTKEYVEHQKRARRSAAGPDGDLADQMDLTWEAGASNVAGPEEGEDEDIMAT